METVRLHRRGTGKAMKVDFTDNSKEVLAAMQEASARALGKCGLVAEGYAKELAPVDTDNLRIHISHAVDKNEARVGTPVEYGVYVEFGTGQYYPGGRNTPWAWQDEEGNWHLTQGQKAQPFIKPAVADHIELYKDIIKSELQGK